ncbi:hypothetical protein NA57DRAFT_80173 [Rhizodiscina lignyota]|uniref:DUF7703 domain-containing protein n=1 Tax=Rhizodiscina lignyota TaxID=1504668 RepID=A0A9P4M2B6_9PEZI|nr:hypothetical protein NA57DRAFT_80173 [Rhizodiscina lignyota]
MLFASWELVSRFSGASTTGTILNSIARIPMLSGFALVLYSRMHLVVTSKRVLRGALAFIIVVAIIFDPPTVVEGVLGHNRTIVLRVIRHCEIIYAVQEVLLAGIYIWGFWGFTKGSHSEPRTKKTFALLIGAEVMIFSVHVVVMVLALMDIVLAKRIILAFTYALKLKVEFLLLNSLLKYSQHEQNRPTIEWLPKLPVDAEKGFVSPVMPVTSCIQTAPWNDFEKHAAMQSLGELRTVQPIISTPSTERSSFIGELALG